MTTPIYVIKRDKSKEELNLDKFHKVVAAACEGISGVSASEIEIKSNIQFYNKIKTSDIQETLIKTAADLISEETPNYQYVAGRLINYHLRKEIYGNYDKIPSVFEHVKKVIGENYYTKELLDWYSEDEFAFLDKHVIKHDRDNLLTFVAMEQMRGKYLVKNRVTGKFYETPQFAFLLIAATLFHRYPKETRLQYVKDFYDALSTFDISLPTPIMAGVRTPQKQFSSCCLIETNDSLDSINATASAIVKYVSQKAGIGIGAGAIRSIGSPVRNGDTSHTGAIPFYKYFLGALKSCSQGGTRSSAATLYVPIWNYEIEDILVLKNNKGTEDTRVRHLDYTIQFSKLFYQRLIEGGNITLFSTSDVPGLLDAFYSENQDEFERLYVQYENSPKIRKKTVKASDLFLSFVQERKETGRIYLMNVDHTNSHGSFHEPIKMSNLCCEITLPTIPLDSIDDPFGRIALCTLAAVNMGNIKTPSDFKKPCDLLVRALNELLDYQEYPIKAAYNSTMEHRPLGIGVINFAYWLAKNDLNYQDIDKEGLKKIHEWFEAWSFYLIESSVNLSKERKENGGRFWGPPTFISSKYEDGILPIDTYKKEVDELADPLYKMPWDKLREDLKEYGILNNCLMAQFPSETSSQVSNSTNGIEPPRAFVSVKQSKDGILKQVVPEYKKLKNKYDLLWKQKSPRGYLKIMAVLQKFIDQAISTNTSYNPEFYPDNKIPISELLKDILFAYRYGLKTLYYFNTNDMSGEIAIEQNKEESEDCDSCKV